MATTAASGDADTQPEVAQSAGGGGPPAHVSSHEAQEQQVHQSGPVEQPCKMLPPGQLQIYPPPPGAPTAAPAGPVRRAAAAAAGTSSFAFSGSLSGSPGAPGAAAAAAGPWAQPALGWVAPLVVSQGAEAAVCSMAGVAATAGEGQWLDRRSSQPLPPSGRGHHADSCLPDQLRERHAAACAGAAAAADLSPTGPASAAARSAAAASCPSPPGTPTACRHLPPLKGVVVQALPPHQGSPLPLRHWRRLVPASLQSGTRCCRRESFHVARSSCTSPAAWCCHFLGRCGSRPTHA